MPVYQVKEGKFDFTPNKVLPYFAFDRVGFVCVFHEDCNYTYADPTQQGDWLKLGGVAFSLFPWDKHTNTAMLGFRYNPISDQLELLDYWHVSGKTDNGIGREPIAFVKRKEKFVWWVRANQSKKQVSINIRTDETTVSKVMDFTSLSTLLCWPVGAYAGGDIPTVQAMTFTEERVVRWGQDGPIVEFTNWT